MPTAGRQGIVGASRQAKEAGRGWFADLNRRDRGEAPVGRYTVRECRNEEILHCCAGDFDRTSRESDEKTPVPSVSAPNFTTPPEITAIAG